ncbi:MAG: redox-sensing transcriptional repressor Rex [Coriobacteriia bacterium]|nr:redox-sensing transcriptional repressor Rex [Coriobacteriia bacterium]
MSDRIPQGVIERLPSYLNALMHLREQGAQTVSSAQLSHLAEVNAAQIRRDFAYFGQFGKRGVGYDIALLVDRIQRILGSDHIQRLAIVGAGNLGSAIAQYDGLRTRGFVVTGVFDKDIRKVGSRVGDLIVRDISELERSVREQGIRFGVIAVPPEAAQDAADRLCAAGVRVVVNYSTAFVEVPEHVTLHNTDPVRELLHTLYYLSRAEGVASV